MVIALIAQARGSGIRDTYLDSFLFMLIVNRITSSIPHISQIFHSGSIFIDHSVAITWFVLDNSLAFIFNLHGIFQALTLHCRVSNIDHSSRFNSFDSKILSPLVCCLLILLINYLSVFVGWSFSVGYECDLLFLSLSSFSFVGVSHCFQYCPLSSLPFI